MSDVATEIKIINCQVQHLILASYPNSFLKTIWILLGFWAAWSERSTALQSGVPLGCIWVTAWHEFWTVPLQCHVVAGCLLARHLPGCTDAHFPPLRFIGRATL